MQDVQPAQAVLQMPRTLRWGSQRPEFVRYNRVEGISAGVRGQTRPQTHLGPLSMTGTARVGIADLEPKAHVDFTRETLPSRVTFSLYNELAAIDERARQLGIDD